MTRYSATAIASFAGVLIRTSDLQAGNDIDAFYIGVGDQFDDDRRYVREVSGGAADYPKVQVLLPISEQNKTSCTISTVGQS